MSPRNGRICCTCWYGYPSKTPRNNRRFDRSRRQTDTGDSTHKLNKILPQYSRQKVNSDEREVVQTTYPGMVAGILIPTKENMRHYASLRNERSERCLPRHTLDTHTHCTHAHTNRMCAIAGFISRSNDTNAPTRHTGRSTAQALYTRAVRRDTVRLLADKITRHKQSPFY